MILVTVVTILTSDSCDSSDNRGGFFLSQLFFFFFLKSWQLKNSNCDKTKKLNWWQNSKSQIVTKLKNSNCNKKKKSNCKKKKIKLLPNSKTQIVTKLNNSNCDKTKKLKLWQNSKKLIVTKLKTPTWHLDNHWDVLGQLFWILATLSKWSSACVRFTQVTRVRVDGWVVENDFQAIPPCWGQH